MAGLPLPATGCDACMLSASLVAARGFSSYIATGHVRYMKQPLHVATHVVLYVQAKQSGCLAGPAGYWLRVAARALRAPSVRTCT